MLIQALCFMYSPFYSFQEVVFGAQRRELLCVLSPPTLRAFSGSM